MPPSSNRTPPHGCDDQSGPQKLHAYLSQHLRLLQAGTSSTLTLPTECALTPAGHTRQKPNCHVPSQQSRLPLFQRQGQWHWPPRQGLYKIRLQQPPVGVSHLRLPLCSAPSNMVSVQQHPAVVSEYLCKEQALGRMLDAFTDTTSLPPLHFN